MIQNRQAEDRIIESNNFIKNVISSISYPLYVIDANSYKIKLATKASGFDPNRSGASTCHALAHDSAQPCDGANHICPVSEVKRTRKPVIVEHLHKNPAGEDRLFEVSAFPVFDEKDEITAIIESNIDVTEQRQSAEDLRRSEEKYRSLIVNAPEPIVVIKDEHIVFANPEALRASEYSEKELYEMPFFNIVSLPEVDKARERYQDRIKGVTDPSFELGLVSKSERIVWAEATAVEIEWEGSRAFLYFIVDITDRKQAENALKDSHSRLEREVVERTKDYKIAKEAAERANILKSEFLANMSHELRTPMHHILNFAHMGNRFKSMKDKTSDCFEKITFAGNKMMELVNNLLDLSNLEVGKVKYIFAENDVLLIINESITRFTQPLETKGISVVIAPPAVSTKVICDSSLISQVVQNLLSNSIKFSEKGNRISISFDEKNLPAEGGLEGKPTTLSLSVSIKDEGPGIPDDELSFIFDRFAQSSKTKTGAGGTGLGLAICHEIIKGHNGLIWAENNPENGATFSFLLPYEQEFLSN